jgi:hypothetical protein
MTRGLRRFLLVTITGRTCQPAALARPYVIFFSGLLVLTWGFAV